MTVPMFEKIRKFIDAAGMSRKMVAINAKITESQLSLLLNGKRKLTVDDYEKLCRAVAVDPAYFWKE